MTSAKEKIIKSFKELLSEKGYENISTTDIAERASISRGTLYYHFKTNDELLTYYANHINQGIIEKSKEIAKSKSISPINRFFLVINTLQLNDPGAVEMINAPENYLLHRKVEKELFSKLPIIFEEIIEDGNKDGSFSCKYPIEAMEMFIVYGLNVFDGDLIDNEEEYRKKEEAFIYFAILLLGIDENQLANIIKEIN